MNQNSVKVIGINDQSRNNASIAYINQVEGLKDILNMDFDKWSNFDSWESIAIQQWIFLGLWRFIKVRKSILNAIVVNILITFKAILITLKKKNALVGKVPT
tara:strand:+ start:677 stop:982 length:306 start_codon:yes stop_codon:yes gene_type:complete